MDGGGEGGGEAEDAEDTKPTTTDEPNAVDDADDGVADKNMLELPPSWVTLLEISRDRWRHRIFF